MPRFSTKKRKNPDVNIRWKKARNSVSENSQNNPNLNIPRTSYNFDTPTSSRSKEKLGDYESKYNNFISDFEYDIINLKQIQDYFGNIAVCIKCQNSLEISKTSLCGLASKIKISCTYCDKQEVFNNSKSITCDNKILYDVNIRLVYGMRSIGRGKAAAETFCGVMNLNAPPFRFFDHEKSLSHAVENICKSAMKKAVQDAVEENGGSRDLAVGIDGSWQKRGHNSLNGIVSATSVSTGKVLDIEIKSKYCKCIGRFQNKHEQECKANYSGTSGGIEVAGALDIFNRSVASYDVRYTEYLGDGDCRAYDDIVKAKPYGDQVTINKNECIGHVQKRMGTRLRNLKAKKEFLTDGKTLGGKNRLTEADITKIQKYYGLAIRRTAKEGLAKMKEEIWSIYFHLSATNETPQYHGLCRSDPEHVWCKYRKAVAENNEYDHTKHFHINPLIMKYIKKIFTDLTDTKLLEKCLWGKTQNACESLNNVIWTVIPKRTFVGLETLRFGVYEAVGVYNEGNIVKCKVFEQLQLEIGKNLVQTMRRLDSLRVKKIEKYFQILQKKLRLKRTQARRVLEDQFEAEEDADNPSYAAGTF
jgi:hypothetical protein